MLSKKTLSLLLLILICANTFAQLSYNTKLLGRWSNDSLHALSSPSGQRFNELWGYFDSAKVKEYIIMGSIDSIYFFDVTNPASIKLCDVEAGRVGGCVNRDFQTYKHYAYAVSDQGRGSLQVFDLKYLPDSVHKVYDSDTLGFRTHTICVYKDLLFMCANNIVSKGFKPMRIASLAQPDSPAFVADFDAPVVGGNKLFSYVHDMVIVDDTAFLSCGNDGLFIFDFKDPLNPKYVYSLDQYPEKGYNHNSWLSKDKKHLVFTDENLGLGIKLYDISNIQLPRLRSIFRSHIGAMAHNPFIVGNNIAYFSYYQDGVYMFDISDDTNPVVIAYYDTYPENTNFTGFEGCWGVYPFLPSGNIFAADMSHGLFALRMNSNGINNTKQLEESLLVSPNPAGESTVVKLFSPSVESATLQIISSHGKLIQNSTIVLQDGKNSIPVETMHLVAGIYFIQVITTHAVYVAKLVKE